MARYGGRGGRGGGRSSAGMSTARSSRGQFGGGGREDRPRQIDVLKAKAQTQAQIDAAKKAQEAAEKKAKNQGLFRNFIDYINPASKLNAAQNMAAQAMGERFLDILNTDDKATVVRSGSRVTGVRDQYGRLTGRDPAQERAMGDGGGAEDRRKRLLLAQTAATTATPSADAGTLGKRVIRTDLAKETEAARSSGGRLSRRSLLSNVSRLGI